MANTTGRGRILSLRHELDGLAYATIDNGLTDTITAVTPSENAGLLAATGGETIVTMLTRIPPGAYRDKRKTRKVA